jgi:hypothetical protein
MRRRVKKRRGRDREQGVKNENDGREGREGDIRTKARGKNNLKLFHTQTVTAEHTAPPV